MTLFLSFVFALLGHWVGLPLWASGVLLYGSFIAMELLVSGSEPV